MSDAIGFVLLTHNKPRQAVRLIDTLNRMFDHPPIACHNDFDKCDLPVDAISRNVSFVRPHFATRWGGYAVVEGMISALELLYGGGKGPDWFVLLSGSDYPIKPAARIIQDLRDTPFDAHIRHEQVLFNGRTRQQGLCRKRYLVKKIKIPIRRRGLPLRHPFIVHRFTPFSKDYPCYTGEFWFTARREVAEYIIDCHRKDSPLTKHYRKLDEYGIFHPDESYFQTLICNAPQFKASNDFLRYIDWSAGYDHPKVLTLDDEAALLSSSAHFGRKFDIDLERQVMDAMDTAVFERAL